MSGARFSLGLSLGALALSLSTISLAHADATATLKAGKADLKSAGALAFGPDGVLFVGDSGNGAIYALDTQDRTNATATAVDIKAIGNKVAALLGTTADQVLINDVAVNPLSKKVYLSVSRGRGPDALPVILRADSSGALQELSLDNIKYSKISLPNAPATDAKDQRGQSLRLDAITDLEYVDGKVLVAGLSNEEFASNLRAIPYPFQNADRGSSIEMYHGSHGRYETNSPVRTFVQYKIGNQSNILAAYTCTPLVKIPVSQLKPGAKVEGTTIAEMGAQNRPLDMIVYNKGGTDYILMSNSARGVMKMSTQGIEKYNAITARTDIAGLPYETVADLKGVEQLDRLDNSKAVLLVRADASTLDLKTIGLP
ncbi:MAG: hypothetical protein QM808_00685 [Steroidobacteraceae bacterium]